MKTTDILAETATASGFADLGLDARLVKRLAALGIETPTPVQAGAIPPMLAGKDVLALAQTGTGKTAAFGLPLIHQLAAARLPAAPRQASALILAPTRELARQILDALTGFSRGTGLGFALVTGGSSINNQIRQLARGADILVATPGRLIDLMERRAVDLSATRHLVLDEADQMLDMGFIHALKRIARTLPRERQTVLFSATMPRLMEAVAAEWLTDPVRVEVTPPGRPISRIAQSVRFLDPAAKLERLIELLAAHRDENALVFTRTKRGAEKIRTALERAGLEAGSIHGNKSQGQRDRALRAFREGRSRVLVATDVAARGIDIPAVRHVYNFDLPNVADNYVHRIGRTARAGASGAAIAFCSAEEMKEFHAIEKLLGTAIPVAEGTPWPGMRSSATKSRRPAGGRGRGAGPRRGQGGRPRRQRSA